MKVKKETTLAVEEAGQGTPEKITSWYILDLIKPIIREELIADCRYDRSGIRINFCNGQRFHLTIKEII